MSAFVEDSSYIPLYIDPPPFSLRRISVKLGMALDVTPESAFDSSICFAARRHKS